MMKRSFYLSLFAACLALVGCGGAGGGDTNDDSPLAYATTVDNRLINFRLGSTNEVDLDVAISGLQVGETIIGIDFRPETNALYAVGSTGRIYTLNTTTGEATIVGSQMATALSGTSFGVDFNPAADRIRIVSDTEQNLRVHPTTAVENVDSPLNPAGNIVAVAYDNNQAGATSTTLYGIDSVSDQLVRIGGLGGDPSPNGGAVTVVGLLGADVNATTSFDITAAGTGVVVAGTGLGNLVYVVNLGSGGASLIGTVPGAAISAFAVRND